MTTLALCLHASLLGLGFSTSKFDMLRALRIPPPTLFLKGLDTSKTQN